MRIASIGFRKDEPMRRWCAIAICTGLTSVAVAEEQPKAEIETARHCLKLQTAQGPS